MTVILHEMMRSPISCHISPATYPSANSKRDIERLKQGRVAERLEQAFHGTLFEQPLTNGLICLSGDEDDRNCFPTDLQRLLQSGPGNAGHGDVEDQTPGLTDAIGREELFSRRECPSRIASLSQQVGQRLAHGLVVIDHR